MKNSDLNKPLPLRDKLDLKFVIGASILVSVIYTVLSFVFFMNSGARLTISEINAGMSLSNPDHSDIDATKPIKANDIDTYASSINSRIKNLDDNNDFGQNGVSDQTLGL